ncbi:MAG: cysteine synthase family protein [Holophaga sp.]|nr:cysteine synthase family protein [Holophaga sp.]
MTTHLLPSTVEAIGGTPLVELARFGRALNGRILAKLEYLNPGFSKKDRIARQIIEDAEANGELKPGQTVVELTSGNTGTGLAIVCGIKGYPFVAVMSRGNSMERARMMGALGAEVVLVDQLPGSLPGQVSGGDLEQVEQAARRITLERNAFRRSISTTRAISVSICSIARPRGDFEQSGGQFDACDFAGTAGSFGGCAAAFKAYRPQIACYLVEPVGAAVIAGRPITQPNHKIQGGGYSMTDLPFVNPAHVDGFLQVSDEEAIQTCRSLARLEGIFAGFSSGANVAAAVQLLQTDLKGKTIVVLLNDSGLKYLSTDLWT